MNRAIASLLILGVCSAGCAARERFNNACEWTHDPASPGVAQHAVGQRRLIEDVTVAEEIAIRYADVRKGDDPDTSKGQLRTRERDKSVWRCSSPRSRSIITLRNRRFEISSDGVNRPWTSRSGWRSPLVRRTLVRPRRDPSSSHHTHELSSRAVALAAPPRGAFSGWYSHLLVDVVAQSAGTSNASAQGAISQP